MDRVMPSFFLVVALLLVTGKCQSCEVLSLSLSSSPLRTAAKMSLSSWTKLPRVRGGAGIISSGGLFSVATIATTTKSSNGDNNDKTKAKTTNAKRDDNNKGRGIFQFSNKRILATRALLLLGVFLGGYRLGVQTGGSAIVDGAFRSVRKAPSRYPLATWLLVVFLARDAWRSVPAWLKPRLLSRAISDVQILLGLKSQDQVATSQRDKDDLADFTTLFGKLGTIRSVFQSRLPYDEDGKPSFNVQASFFALLKVTREIKAARISTRDEFYQTSGRPATLEDMDQLDELMEYADWAYDDADKPLKELLEDKGYILLKHDKTTVPGYLGHFVAIPRDKSNKIALVGVKGTSGLEDMITDMCGAAVDVNLEHPYYKYADTTTLRAHEGIMIGTRRLAQDLQPFVENLLLPQGYKIVIVGHSLGAASAALLGVLLRSQIPALQEYDTKDGPSNKLMQVYAFASPPSLDLENALVTSSFVTTVVNNCDIITRCNVSPLSATIDVLKAVNDKLEATKDIDEKGRAGWKFWKSRAKEAAKQVDEDAQSRSKQLLSDADELFKAVSIATEAITKNGDKDHLYVPGKVVLMYDEWGQHTNITNDGDNNNQNQQEVFANHVADKAIVCNGAAQPLQYIEFDSRLLDDHMTEDYKSSIRNVLSSMENK